MMYRYAAEPLFFEQIKTKNAKIIYADSMKYFIIFTSIIFLVIIFYIDFFKLLINRNYHEGLMIVPIILFSYVLNGVLFNVNIWFKIKKKTEFSIIVIGTGAIITIILNIILIPRIKYLGCAITHVIAYAVMIILSYSFGRSRYKINYDYKRIVEIISVAMVLLVINWLFRSKCMMVEIVVNTALLVIYLFYLNKREKLYNVFVKR